MNRGFFRPVILIHGLIGTLADPDIAIPLGPYRVLAPDLIGYGALAGAPPEDITLDAQVEHARAAVLAAFGGERVDLVGHSVGGVVAVLLAHRHPDLVASVTSVEGNFTLKDAFWSGKVAAMSPREADDMMGGFRADPAGWLARAGVAADERTLALARRSLDNQPASTVRATARSVVDVTGRPDYLPLVGRVFRSTRVHLMAGERSRSGWDVPEWALASATSMTILPERGHMMMLENASEFGAALARILDHEVA